MISVIAADDRVPILDKKIPSFVEAFSPPQGSPEEEPLAECLERFQRYVARVHPNAAKLEILVEPSIALMKVTPPTFAKFGKLLPDVSVEDSIRYAGNLLNLNVNVDQTKSRVILTKASFEK